MDLKKFLIIVIGFILFTIVGTQSHELGHILVAKFFGYKTSLNYGSMTYSKGKKREELREFYSLYREEIKKG